MMDAEATSSSSGVSFLMAYRASPSHIHSTRAGYLGQQLDGREKDDGAARGESR
jgi:hypothetical protein